MANPNKKSNAKTNNQNTGFATVQEVGMTVGTFVLTDLLARKLTGGKKWLAKGIGVAVTWALKSTGLLSNSFGPLFRGIAKFGNPNGNFYKTCMSIADRCDENAFKNTPFWKDSSTGVGDDTLTSDVIKENISEGIQEGYANGTTIADMQNNGTQFATEGYLLDVANNPSIATEAVENSVGDITMLIEDQIKDPDKLSTKDKDTIDGMYRTSLKGLAGYDYGIDKGILQTYSRYDSNYDKAKEGQKHIMTACGKEMAKSMFRTNEKSPECISEETWEELLKLDAKYHFITENQWEILAQKDFQNINFLSYRNEHDEHIMTQQLEESEATIPEIETETNTPETETQNEPVSDNEQENTSDEPQLILEDAPDPEYAWDFSESAETTTKEIKPTQENTEDARGFYKQATEKFGDILENDIEQQTQEGYQI